MNELGSIKPIGLKLSGWIFSEAGLSRARNKSKRVEELMIKGMMYEKEQALKSKSNSVGLVKAVILRLVRVVNDSINKFTNDIHKAIKVKRLNNPLIS
jgi:hypothetical protein